MAGLLVTGEVLSSLHLCRITIRHPDDIHTSDVVRVTAHPNSLLVRFSDGNVLKVNTPKGVELTSGNPEFVISNGRYINVRLVLSEKSKMLRNIYSDLAGVIRSLTIKSPYDVLRAKDLVIACSGCDVLLSECVNFDRIREIPATHWEQSKEEWFCHGHGSAFDKLKPGAVAPKLRDCFFSDLYFQLKAEVLLDAHHRVDCQSNAVCFNCNNVFGVQEKDQVKLWTHRIKWLENTDARSLVYHSDEITLLVSLIDNLSDTLAVNSRVVFTKHSTPKTFLYMCVMDVNLSVLTSQDARKATQDSNKDIAENFMAVNISDGSHLSSTSHKKNKRCTFDEYKAEVIMEKCSVIKVLFKLVRGENEETSKWNDDVNVNVFQCSESLFDTVSGILADSAQDLEPIQGEQLTVGYIIRK